MRTVHADEISEGMGFVISEKITSIIVVEEDGKIPVHIENLERILYGMRLLQDYEIEGFEKFIKALDFGIRKLKLREFLEKDKNNEFKTGLESIITMLRDQGLEDMTVRELVEMLFLDDMETEVPSKRISSIQGEG